jgi:hypothetical protein
VEICFQGISDQVESRPGQAVCGTCLRFDDVSLRNR